MKITQEDLERWRENSLQVAEAKGEPKETIDQLRRTKLILIPEGSGRMFYGWADYAFNQVSVYQTNPSRYLPQSLREIWNQSGMDHELIGHLGNNLAGRRYDEGAACITQREFMAERSKGSLVWKLALLIEPIVTKVRLRKNKRFYA